MQTSTVKESALGKVFIEFELIASAFMCYNLLNNRVYRGNSIEINFADRDHYMIKNLS